MRPGAGSGRGGPGAGSGRGGPGAGRRLRGRRTARKGREPQGAASSAGVRRLQLPSARSGMARLPPAAPFNRAPPRLCPDAPRAGGETSARESERARPGARAAGRTGVRGGHSLCGAGRGARGLVQPGPGPAGRPWCPRRAGGSGAGPAPAPPGSRPGRVGPGGPAARLPTGSTRWDRCSAQAVFFPGLSLLFSGHCRPLSSPPGARARPCQRAAWRHRDCGSLFINDHVIELKGLFY